ncbi:MAG: apolipoprotein N-acyltransferase [Elusimicrobiales bacterium]|jgi:apolipoprotein N-acyltransferase
MRSSARSVLALEFCALAASGIAAGICFWPGNYGLLFWFVFAPFFLIIMKRDWKAAFFRGWLFGSFAWMSGMYWFVPPLLKFLNIHLAAALALFLAVCAWHGLSFALLAGATRALNGYLAPRLGWTDGTILLLTAAPVMAAIERFFPMLFPVYFANTQYFHLPQVQLLEIFGPAGPLWLIMGFNVAVYMLVEAVRERSSGTKRDGAGGLSYPASVFGALCVLALLNEYYGSLRIRQLDEAVKKEAARGHSLKVSAIQGSVPVDSGETLAAYRSLTAETLRTNRPELIIWPESVYGRTAVYGAGRGPSGQETVFEPAFARALRADAPWKTYMLMGAGGRLLDGPEQAAKRNIAFLTGPDRELLGLTEKRRLFPFGEYIPLGGSFPALYRLFPRSDDISPGGSSQLLSFAGVRAGVVICYEDLYTEASREFAKKGANVLFNITNEARFGFEVSPEQHLNFSALRAIENRKFLVRAVNTGISAVIDPAGRITDRLAVKERGAVTAGIQLMDRRTFYCAHGDLLCLFGILLVLALVLFAGIKCRFTTFYRKNF